MSYFEATSVFDSSLGEVDFFIEGAVGSLGVRRQTEYGTFVKAGFVLLGAKFEAFAEGIIEDFVEQLSGKKPKAKHLPLELRTNATTLLLSGCAPGGTFQFKPERIQSLRDAAALWEEDSTIDPIPTNNKFNYGKHGSKEIAALFERVGVNDLYSTCEVEEEEEEALIVTSTVRRSIAPDIDSLTHIRNNIIHSDASPGNITHQQLQGYRDRLWEFAYLVDLRLERALGFIEAKMHENP